MKTRRAKLTTKIFVYIYAVVIIANSILGAVIYLQTSRNTVNQIAASAKDLATSAAASVDPEDFREAIEQGDSSEGYERVNNRLSAFLDAEQLQYVYSFSKTEDGKWYFVVDTDEEGAAFKEAYEADELMEAAYLGEAIADTESSSDEWGTYLSAYCPIKDGNEVIGLVGVDVDYSNVEATLNHLRLFLGLICLGIYVILLVAIGLICRRLHIGFNLLNDKVLELAGSDGDLSKHIEIHSGDEFETIAGNFNAFINQVHGLTCKVSDASRSNASTVGSMNQEILNLSANMEECAATSESVSEQIAEVAEQTNDLARQISETNDYVLVKSAKAKEEAHYAMRQKEEANALIAELNDQIQDALLQAKSIEQVQQVVQEISDISLQTKILSLNARVEAARAGDAGKGFSVVATEIGDLSTKTEESVEGIDAINAKVQRAVVSLHESISRLNDFVTGSVLADYEGYARLGMEFGESTKTISEQMIELNEGSAAISEQISQANLSMSDISAAVSDSARQLEQVSLSSDTITNQMRELLDNSLLN